MATLYHLWPDPFSARVRITLHERGARLEMVDLATATDSSVLDDHSPRGEVPLLLTGKNAIWESMAICEYLDETTPGRPLIPKNPARAGICRSWFYVATHLLAKPVFEIAMSRNEVLPEALEADGRSRIASTLSFLERQLSPGRPYLLGDDFTLADIAFTPFVVNLARFDIELADDQHKVRAYIQRLRNRASVVEAMTIPHPAS